MRQSSLCLAFVAWTLLASCSSSPSQYQPLGMTSEEIRMTTDTERLKSAQKSLAAQLLGKEKDDFPAEFALLNDVSQRLVELETSKLEKELKALRIKADGDLRNRVSLPNLAPLKKQLESDKTLPPSLLPEILHPIVREQASSESLMRALETEAGQQTLTAERRAKVYHYLFVLSGDSKWKEIRDKQMEVIIKAIQTAADNNVFSSDLEKKIDFVRSIYVEEPKKIIAEMHTLYAAIYAYRHAQARQKADREAAHKVLLSLTHKPDYPEIKNKLNPHAEKIADEYASDVAESIARGRSLADAFRLYQREIEVRDLVGLKPRPHPDTAQLIQQFANKYHTVNKKNPYAALGLLLAQQTIEPKTANLKDTLEQQFAQVADTTIKSISLAPFRSRYDDVNYGDTITSLITQHLYDALENRIQIVEQGTGASSDTLITGNILEVKVESSQTRNKKQMLVNVGEVRRTNPAYIAWLERPPKERKKLEKPDETMLEQKQQTVFITSTLHRKTGVFAVSYRLIDNSNRRVIFPDSITIQAEHEDESNEGLEVGELVVPYKIAKLPSDTEILQNLSQSVASTIAGNLAGVLLNQEIEYLKAADKSATQNNCDEEVEHLAKAVSLLAAKNKGIKDTEVPTRRLVDRALSCL
jgi:hypothetical protein